MINTFQIILGNYMTITYSICNPQLVIPDKYMIMVKTTANWQKTKQTLSKKK